MQGHNGGKQNKKTLFAVLGLVFVAIASIVAFFLFGEIAVRSKYTKFNGGEGYIISSSLSEDGISFTRQYFSANTEYKSTYSGNAEFQNTNGETVVVNPESFVHYLDGSIGFLKKVALLDLLSLKAEEGGVITYYNMQPASVLGYLSGKYIAELQGNRTSFDAIIIKSAENKFLVASPLIDLDINGNKKTFKNGYLEITYFDGDIVRVENQETTFQGIPEEMNIYLDNVKIDLKNKKIFKDDVLALEFGMITIDSDDNIVLSDVEEELDIEDEDDGDSPQNNGGASNAENSEEDNINPIEDLAGGTIAGETYDDNSEEINEYARSGDPVFVITNMNVSANSFEASVEIEDNDGVLTGDMRVEVIEIATSKPVYQERLMNGELSFDVETENLQPETGYSFVVTAGYSKDGVELTRTFIQRTFITEAVGVYLKENYVAQNLISVHVSKSGYSGIEKVTAVLYKDDGTRVQSKAVDFGEGHSQIVDFDGLSTNTKYYIRLENFEYRGMNVVDSFSIQQDFLTLKESPTIGNPYFTIDNRNSLFHLDIDNIKLSNGEDGGLGRLYDQDNGIVSCRYEIYNATNETAPVLVHVAEKDSCSGVDVAVADANVEDAKIQREKPYEFRVVVVFNDNQREREYATGFSDIMQMDGVTFPTLRFEEEEVTSDWIKGFIIITDENETLEKNPILKVSYRDSDGAVKSFKYRAETKKDGNIEIPFDKKGLKQNKTYDISVDGMIDLHDGNPNIEGKIGSVVVKTKPTKDFILKHTGDGYNDFEHAFNLQVQLQSADTDDEGDAARQASTLESLTFNIYEGDDVVQYDNDGNLIINKISIGSFIEKSEEGKASQYESTLRDKFYDSSFNLTSDKFKSSGSTISYTAGKKYTICLSEAKDYANNDIVIRERCFVVEAQKALDLGGISVNPIYNQSLPEEERKKELNSNTVVGYTISATVQDFNARTPNDVVEFYLYDDSGNVITGLHRIVAEKCGEVDSAKYTGSGRELIACTITKDEGTTTFKVYFDDDRGFSRGNRYIIKYRVRLNATGDVNKGYDKVVPENEEGMKYFSIDTEKQKPILKMYPEKLVNESGKYSWYWKYNLSDVDNALVGKSIYYTLGEGGELSFSLERGEEERDGEFISRRFELGDLNSPSELNVYYKAQLKNYESEEIVNIITQKIDGSFGDGIGYSIYGGVDNENKVNGWSDAWNNYRSKIVIDNWEEIRERVTEVDLRLCYEDDGDIDC